MSTCPTSTRWRRATRSGPSAPSSSRPPSHPRPRRCPGRRPAGPRRAGQGHQGHRDLGLRRRVGRAAGHGIGTLLGALGGYFGGKVGDFLEWLYNVFTSIPDILLIFAFAAVFGRGHRHGGADPGLTGWTGLYRQVRAEFMKHRGREYVRAAEAIGASAGARMFRHILPNVSHVILVRMSLLVVGFIKSEVILSYLGLGVPVDQVSWGTMLAEAQAS
jgi:ABC-type dipeptide/oligopeptide/nickel transport system permease subunit